MVKLIDTAAYELLDGSNNLIRDNILWEYKFYYTEDTPCITIGLIAGEKQVSRVTFHGIIESDFYFNKTGPQYITDYKIFF